MIDTHTNLHLTIRYHSAPNIALVKYWGKFHEAQILPINDSIGVTLSTEDLSTITTCSFTNSIQEDEFILNGKKVQVGKRMRRVLQEIRKAARKSQRFEGLSQQQWRGLYFSIESSNSFPTASGMASSASGFSCLATALNGLFGNILQERELSRLARWGSGSAARSVYGGLVKWQGVGGEYQQRKQVEGEQLQTLSRKCISYTIKPAKELSYMKVVMLLTSDKQKDVSSTQGMKLSVQTSQLIKHRNNIAQARISKLVDLLSLIDQARKNNDTAQQYELFSSVAEQIMRDSNQLHAICLDTFPPIFYLNSFSKMIISIVLTVINTSSSPCKVAYSFDAGAHAFLFVHQSMLKGVLHYFAQLFQLKEEALNEKGKKILSEKYESSKFSKFQGELISPSQMWVTDVGEGAMPC